jgi:hypothetical protein
VPEIFFDMMEGTGVFNLGAGKKSLLISGKSQFLNDFLFPSSESNH